MDTLHSRAKGYVSQVFPRMLLLLLLAAGASHAAGSKLVSGGDTGEKPQSKIFFHDGAYWALLDGPDGIAFYEKTGDSWQQGTFVDAVLTNSGNADVKWNGSTLFVLVYSSSPKLFKYSYDYNMRSWFLYSGFPVTVPRPSGSETMVLEQDSTGRLWTTAEGNTDVNVYYSTSSDHKSWSSSPIILRSGLSSDDISSIVAFDGDKIGVFWSDQKRDEFGFAVHHDGDPPTSWQSVEIADEGSGHADDHISLAYDSQGRVYAVSKDDSDRMRVHRRSTSGNWTSVSNVTGVDGTRGIIMVNEDDNDVYVFYTRWGVSPNRIEYVKASLNSLDFGSRTTFITASSHLNNVTGTKQILPAGNLLAIASTSGSIYWNGYGTPPGSDPTDVPPPGMPLNLTSTQIPSYAAGALVLPFDEGGGQQAADISGGGHAARLGVLSLWDTSDPAWINGVHGSGLSFDGFDDVAVVDDSPDFDFPGSFTVEAWLRRDASLTGALLNKDDGGSSAYRLLIDAGGAVEFRWEDQNGQRHETFSPSLLGLGSWHHVACVYDQAVSQNRIYIDGALVATSSASGSPATSSGDLFIGARSATASSDYFAGAIDVLRLVPDAVYSDNFVPNAAPDNNDPQMVRLQWDPPVLGGEAAGYQVYRSVDGGSYSQVASNLGSTTWVDNDLLTGDLCYQVSAYNVEDEEGSPSNSVCEMVEPPGNPPPDAPESLTLTQQSQSILVQWSPSSSGTQAVAYDVYRSFNAGSFVLLSRVSQTQYADSDLSSGELCYRVLAVDAEAQESQPSTSECTFYTAPPPSAPQDVAANLGQSDPGISVGEAAFGMDAGSGQTLVDDAQHGHDGVLGSSSSPESSDPVWTSGVTGSALLFDGSNDRVTIPHASSLEFGGSFTIEAWVNRASEGESHCVLSKGDSDQRNYWMLLTSTGKVDLRWETAGGANHGTKTSATIPVNEWHHIACVYDQAAGENRIYIDGVLVENDSDSGTPVTSTDAVYLGARLSSGSLKDFFHGQIDLVRLTPAAIYDANFTPSTDYRSGESSPIVEVSWNPPSSPGPFQGYHVYRRAGSGAFVKLTGAPVAATNFTDSDLVPETLCYEITAVDGANQEGDRSASACVDGNSGPPPPPPGAPSNFTAVLQETNSARLDWEPPAQGTAVSYNVFRKLPGGNFELLDNETSNSFTDQDLPDGQTCYHVTAVDELDQEGASTDDACVQVLPPPGPPPSEPLDPQVVLAQVPGSSSGSAVYLFDEGQGGSFADDSGNGNDGFLGDLPGADSQDPTWTAGQAGTALLFDGTNDYSQVPDAPGLRFDGSFTIEAWIYQATPGGIDVIVSKGDSNQRNYWMRVNRDGALDFRWETPGGANHGTESGPVITSGSWQHVACVYDQTAGENRLYVDGSLVTVDADSGTPVTSDDPLIVGARLSGGRTKEYFDGSIDLLRLSPGVIYTADFTPASQFAPSSTETVAEISWNPPSSNNAVGYHVYRSIDGAPNVRLTSSPLTTTAFTDDALVMGTLCYQITALDVLAQEGAPSDPVCENVTDGSPPPPPAPGAPQNLTATTTQTPGGVQGAAVFAMDEGSGQTVMDASSHAHDGQLGASAAVDSNDPNWVSGVAGSALLFDGGNDYVVVEDTPELRLPGSFTLEAWVYRASSGSNHCILSKGDSDQRNFWMRLDRSGHVDFRWETDGGANHGTESSASIPTGSWHHIACVYDQDAGRNRIYIDGVMVEDDNDAGTPTTSNDPLYIGSRLSGGSLKDYFDGMIDLVRVSPGAIYDADFTPPLDYPQANPTTAISLSWEAPASGSVATYQVYRQQNGGAFEWLDTGPLAQPGYLDEDPGSGTICYQITSRDEWSQESEASNAACVSVTVAKASAGRSSTTLAWQGPAFNVYPNPFNPQTAILFRLPDRRRVQLNLYDVRGSRVATLVNGEMGAGQHVVRWDGKNDRGLTAGSGAYFLVLRSRDILEKRKLIVLK